MAVNIVFNAINAANMNTDTAIAVGENNQVGWSAHGKLMFANGWSFGAAFNTNVLNTLIDNDVIDNPIMDNDAIPGLQNQSI